jgi:putative endonuclease
MPMFYIYILYSETADKYYIGQTEDVQRRLFQHNNPLEAQKFTAKCIPWKLPLYFKVNENRGDAMRVEKFIKSQKSRNFILELIRNKANNDFFIKLVHDVVR